MGDNTNQQYPSYNDDNSQIVVPPSVQTYDDLQEPEVVPISISPGSPESAPIPMPKEQPAESIEYGYEKLKQIETTNENLSQIERKEAKPPQPQDDAPSQPQSQVSPPALPAVKPQGPKIFGYYIPPSITSNIQAIRQKKGTGDPQDATTWIYVLLDRLLEKQTYKD